jgi:glycosyltransferase involved in cell wall biosynthesis
VSASREPLVSVVTPVYNGADFLAECIESVLGQTFTNFEYLIVDNCSTDRSLEIALSFAKKDDRIRVHRNERFVGVIDNHNIAFNLISRAAKYCKVVSADDFLFADCLSRMIGFAEANPSVGIVGSYQLAGSGDVNFQGFQYPRAVFAGREICRRIFLDGRPSFGFGDPTSILYRADLVRSSKAFYPNQSPHADTSACFAYLRNSDFGFVYQVLSYQRIHTETQSSRSAQINRYASAYLSDLIQYGPSYLSQEELDRVLKRQLASYHRFLAVNALPFKGKDFWNYHKGRLEELGHPLRLAAVLKAAAITILREMLNPERALRKLRKRIVSQSRDAIAQAAPPSPATARKASGSRTGLAQPSSITRLGKL